MNNATNARSDRHPLSSLIVQLILLGINLFLMIPVWRNMFHPPPGGASETVLLLIPFVFLLLPALIAYRGYRWWRADSLRTSLLRKTTVALSLSVLLPVLAFLLRLLAQLVGILQRGGFSG